MGIGDLAAETGVKVVTIRYYEQIGVLPAVKRTSLITGAMEETTSGGCASFAGAAIWDSRSVRSAIYCGCRPKMAHPVRKYARWPHSSRRQSKVRSPISSGLPRNCGVSVRHVTAAGLWLTVGSSKRFLPAPAR